MDITAFNRNAWNLQSLEGCRWSTPWPDDVINKAKKGKWEVILTPNKAVPAAWFPGHPDLAGTDLLALACGGGQQVPVFAAAGATVTSFDNSDIQLQKDEDTCAKHKLSLTTVQGDMIDLSALDDESFDIVFNPVSNVFSSEILPVWKECHRVLRPGGRLLCGFMNPAFFLFDHYEAEETGQINLRFPLPYSDLESLEKDVLEDHLKAQVSIEFSHSLQEQIGGQCDAGFAIQGFYEDTWDDESSILNPWLPIFMASCGIRM